MGDIKVLDGVMAARSYLLDGYQRVDAVAAASADLGLTKQQEVEVDAYLLGGYFRIGSDEGKERR